MKKMTLTLCSYYILTKRQGNSYFLCARYKDNSFLMNEHSEIEELNRGEKKTKNLFALISVLIYASK